MTELRKIVEEVADAEPDDMQTTTTAHIALLYFHIRALACHCECLGMNAENSHAVCIGSQEIPYSQAHYGEVMMKWGLINEKGEPKV